MKLKNGILATLELFCCLWTNQTNPCKRLSLYSRPSCTYYPKTSYSLEFSWLKILCQAWALGFPANSIECSRNLNIWEIAREVILLLAWSRTMMLLRSERAVPNLPPPPLRVAFHQLVSILGRASQKGTINVSESWKHLYQVCLYRSQPVTLALAADKLSK